MKILDTPVLITVSGSHSLEKDPIELLTKGIYKQENGTDYLEYEEFEPSSNKPTLTKITVKDQVVMLERNGAIQNYTTFIKNSWSQSATDYDGFSLNISVYPREINYDFSPEKGWLEIEYDSLLGAISSSSKLSIEYQCIDKGNNGN